MKTFSAPQVLFVALFIIKLAMPASVLAGQRTGAVVYKNQLIPSVQLKGIEISATRPAILCHAKKHNGELIPSVQMNEITISASGNNDKGTNGFKPVAFQGIRTAVIAWRGSMIPQVEANEVVFVAERNPVADNTTESEMIAEEQPVFHVSVRHAFDRVGGFLMDQGKEMLRKLVEVY